MHLPLPGFYSTRSLSAGVRVCMCCVVGAHALLHSFYFMFMFMYFSHHNQDPGTPVVVTVPIRIVIVIASTL